jgi:hypothetical protein
MVRYLAPAALILLAGLLLTLAPAARGRPQATVRGQVRLNGAPLERGVVLLHGPGGRLSAPVHEGHFEFPLAPVAGVRYTVHPVSNSWTPAASPVPPERYADVRTAGLEGELAEGTQEVTLCLDDGPAPGVVTEETRGYNGGPSPAEPLLPTGARNDLHAGSARGARAD